MPSIEVRRIRVLPDRISFEVRIADPGLRWTDRRLAQRALELRPDLAGHACVNASGPVFGSVIADTSTPHLIEHCAIDFLVEGACDASRTQMGTSTWVDAEQGLACVELSMRDDLEVLRAFARAVDFVEELFAESAANAWEPGSGTSKPARPYNGE